MQSPSHQIDHSLRELARQQPLRLGISGHCMHPALQDGAAVLIQPRRGPYLPGDVLVFRANDGRHYCHRLMVAYRRRGEPRYLTQSDNGPRPDASFPPARILGRVIGGECAPSIHSPTLPHRLQCAWRGGLFLLRRAFGGAKGLDHGFGHRAKYGPDRS